MPKQRKNPVTDAEIVAAYRACRSVPKIAESLGIGATTAHRVLKRNNVELTGLQEYRRSMISPKGEPYIGVYQGSTEQILEWYTAGLSMRVIAGRIGRSVHVVQRRVKKAGISRPWRSGGPDHSMWKGGRLDAGGGYLRVWVADDDPMAVMRTHQGYVLEHRLVMARKLGRPLRDTETVHHINGERSDNKPSNLEVHQGKHGNTVVMCCLDCGSRNIGHVGIRER